MVRYEALILSVPEITQDEAKTVESQFDRVIKGVKGTMISFERWGKYRLAYPVRKNDYGVYFLARFEVDQTGPIVKDLNTLIAVKLNDLVMRAMFSALDPKQSLAYQRPLSLEEAPPREGYFREGRPAGPRRYDRFDRSDRGPRDAQASREYGYERADVAAQEVTSESQEG